MIGIDIGSQKTMLIQGDGEIIRTSTGSISRPTVISLGSGCRLFGEEAAVQNSSDGVVSMINLLCGKVESDLPELTAFQYSKSCLNSSRRSDESDSTEITMLVDYPEGPEMFRVSDLLGMYISHLWENVTTSVVGDAVEVAAATAAAAAAGESDVNTKVHNAPGVAFVLPPDFTEKMRKNYQDACFVAGLDASTVSFVDMSECVVRAYERKVNALPDAERSSMVDKNVLLLDMGHTHCLLVLVHVEAAEGGMKENENGGGVAAAGKAPFLCAKKRGYSYSDSLGGSFFDISLFKHFSGVVEKQGGEAVVAGSKRGVRLMNGCERIRKLLSQLTEAKVTVENLTDAGDVSFSLTRDDLSSICAEQLDQFRGLLLGLFTAAAATSPGAETTTTTTTADVSHIEVLGGATRMQVIQQVVCSVFSHITTLGAKLDDGSMALGATLASSSSTCSSSSSAVSSSEVNNSTETDVGSCTDDATTASAVDVVKVDDIIISEYLQKSRERELRLRKKDAEQRAVLALRNKMESYILDMRAAPNRKNGDSIDKEALNKILDENEEWMWDNVESTLATLEEKYTLLCSQVESICEQYLVAVEADRKAVEAALEAEAAAAALQRGEDGEEADDHDNRKLRKPERMRMVIKNKEEGTELFKGGNYRPAAARYHKALTHSAKFFDLSAEDEAEVKAVKLSLFLNLASCYIKLQSWEQVLRNCDDALALDAANVKALFRRCAYWENKKDWDRAQADIKRCEQINAAAGVDDKLVTKTAERIKKEIQKQKSKEKSMWGKAFAAN